ncbi:hypothetical protein BIW11_01421, partial [Tropilaelaps mercedesae]
FEATKSTKGASKARRDLINGEVANLRDLLPLPSSTRQRLSQLQLMALVCVFVRKSNYFINYFKQDAARGMVTTSCRGDGLNSEFKHFLRLPLAGELAGAQTLDEVTQELANLQVFTSEEPVMALLAASERCPRTRQRSEGLFVLHHFEAALECTPSDYRRLHATSSYN